MVLLFSKIIYVARFWLCIVNFWLPRGSFWLMVSCFGCIQSSRPQHIISAGTVMFALNGDQLRADQFGKVVFYAGNAA